MSKLNNRWLAVLLACCIGGATACVSIKPSTVELSTQVGQRMSEMEKIHQLALQRYFDMEEKRIEDFLTNTWEPLFLKNFLGTSGILQLLQNTAAIDDKGKRILAEGIALYLTDRTEADKAATDLVAKLTTSRKDEAAMVKSVLVRYVEDKKLENAVTHIVALLGTDEPAQIILEFAEAAHREMLAQRKEMLAPLQQARAEAVSTLSEAYAELIRGQSTITGRLEAAAKRSKQQDELLGKLGVKPVSVALATKMADVSGKVTNALTKAQEVVDKQKPGEKINIVSAIKDALR